MRCTQFIGHTNSVHEFIVNKCKLKKKLKTVLGMFDEDICTLKQYEDEDGNIWEEFVQHDPWSSGPMIFLAIRNTNTGEVRGWKCEDIDGKEYVDYGEGTFFA